MIRTQSWSPPAQFLRNSARRGRAGPWVGPACFSLDDLLCIIILLIRHVVLPGPGVDLTAETSSGNAEYWHQSVPPLVPWTQGKVLPGSVTLSYPGQHSQSESSFRQPRLEDFWKYFIHLTLKSYKCSHYFTLKTPSSTQTNYPNFEVHYVNWFASFLQVLFTSKCSLLMVV